MVFRLTMVVPFKFVFSLLQYNPHLAVNQQKKKCGNFDFYPGQKLPQKIGTFREKWYFA